MRLIPFSRTEQMLGRETKQNSIPLEVDSNPLLTGQRGLKVS